MNIKEVKAYEITLTELELSALRILIGNMSYSERHEFGLTNAENDRLSSLYNDFNAVIDSK